MIPSSAAGANLKKINTLFAVGVFYSDRKGITFRKIPGMTPLTENDINQLVYDTKPLSMQVQKLYNVTTDDTVKTTLEQTDDKNYSIPTLSKLASISGDTTYKKQLIRRNDQRFDSSGNALNQQTDASQQLINDSSTDYVATYRAPATYRDGAVVYDIYDKFANLVQVTYDDGIIAANEYLLNADLEKYTVELIINNELSYTKNVRQLDEDGKLPEHFYDKFGNTVVGIEDDAIIVKNTKIPVIRNYAGDPIKFNVFDSTYTTRRLKDVITRL
jgi:hypothetical protein